MLRKKTLNFRKYVVVWFLFLNENKIFKLNLFVIIIYEMKNNGDKSFLINDVLV